MFDVGVVERVEGELRSLVEGLEPGLLSAEAAAGLVERFSVIERLAGAGGALAAGRVAQSRVWRDEGDRSAAHWVARKTASTVGRAAGVLETVERLGGLAATDEAFRAGRLSSAQAVEVASAAAADPGREVDLLEVAASEGLHGLRERARQVRAAAEPDEAARYRAVHRSRALRHWMDPDGAFRLDARLTPDAGASVLAALEPWQVQVFREARAAGIRDSYAAYHADALVALAQASTGPATEPAEAGTARVVGEAGAPTGPARAGGAGGCTGRCRGPRAVIHVRVDHAALVRGHTQPGETCDIPGIGPIPVTVARALATDSFVKVIATDGTDVRTIAHPGRTIPAQLRTALETRDPVCVVPGCATRDRLEIDHVHPYAQGGPTHLDNLARLCHWHHHLKTHQGWTLTRTPDHHWHWHPPPTPRE